MRTSVTSNARASLDDALHALPESVWLAAVFAVSSWVPSEDAAAAGVACVEDTYRGTPAAFAYALGRVQANDDMDALGSPTFLGDVSAALRLAFTDLDLATLDVVVLKRAGRIVRLRRDGALPACGQAVVVDVGQLYQHLCQHLANARVLACSDGRTRFLGDMAMGATGAVVTVLLFAMMLR